MIEINFQNIPEFYKKSNFLEQFQDEENFFVPEENYVESLEIYTPQDFCKLINVINFWDLKSQEAFDSIISYLQNNSNIINFDFIEKKSKRK